jgi:4'-phosphopantetheinyl transferase
LSTLVGQRSGIVREVHLRDLSFPGDGSVLVVLAELAAFLPELAAYQELLSPADRARADRFVTAALRGSFVTAHGLMRAVLGRCLELDPAALSFAETARGKPFLLPPASVATFNLSHSRRFVALALTRATHDELGVDVEDVERQVSAGLVDACTSPGERALFHEGLSETERRALFFRIWTRKEAVLKASGLGIGVRLSSVDVAPQLESATVLWDEGRQRHHVTSFAGLPEGLCGALAQAGPSPGPFELLRLVPEIR